MKQKIQDIFGIFIFVIFSIAIFKMIPEPPTKPAKKNGNGFEIDLNYKAHLIGRGKNWGLFNNVNNKSDIKVLDAWKIDEGNNKVVVAVIDTGIDPTHPNLVKNLWHNPSNPSEYGWNFNSDQPNPIDGHGHGTHIAGIIGAVPDMVSGVSGVSHHVSIMPIEYYSDSNSGAINLRHTIEAIDYAVTHGANIINYSGGGPEFSEAEYLALKRAEAKGILVVAAAGNDHKDTDLEDNYYYPAAYHLSNMISVASLDIQTKLLNSSNWGKNHVDVAAPGENIFSTLPGSGYGYMTGTSQATAFVSGLAALILSENPNLTPIEVRRIIMESVDKIDGLQDKVASGGKINAAKALKMVVEEKTKAARLLSEVPQDKPLMGF